MTVSTFALLSKVTIEFFWGEAYWGLTDGLRRLRILRLIVCIIPFLALGIVIKCLIDERRASATSEPFDSYELGKAFHEYDQKQMLIRLLTQVERQQAQLDRMEVKVNRVEETATNGQNAILGIILIGGGSILKDILILKFRRERAKLKNGN